MEDKNFERDRLLGEIHGTVKGLDKKLDQHLEAQADVNKNFGGRIDSLENKDWYARGKQARRQAGWGALGGGVITLISLLLQLFKHPTAGP